MPLHPVTPFPWQTPGTLGAGRCWHLLFHPRSWWHWSLATLHVTGPWPLPVLPGALCTLLSPRAAPGGCQCSSCGALPPQLPCIKLSIPPGLFAYTSLSGGRCKRLAVFLRGLYITFSVGFILLQSSFGLWAAGIFIQSCKLMLRAACGVKPVSRQKLCWSSGSGKWAVSQQ